MLNIRVRKRMAPVHLRKPLAQGRPGAGDQTKDG
jgi:hypothetical protein